MSPRSPINIPDLKLWLLEKCCGVQGDHKYQWMQKAYDLQLLNWKQAARIMELEQELRLAKKHASSLANSQWVRHE